MSLSGFSQILILNYFNKKESKLQILKNVGRNKKILLEGSKNQSIGGDDMKKLVKKDELSQKAGIVAMSRNRFTDNDIAKLTAKLKKFALVYDGDFFQIYGE